MTYQIIPTSQAPDAKPIGLSKTLTTDWTSIIEIPSYEVPQQSFGGGTDEVPGVGEVISPMLVSNKTTSTATISIRMFRATEETYFSIVNELPVPAYDIMAIPLNGQFILSGDIVEVKSDTNESLDITLSYTIGQAEEDDVV